MSALKAQLRLNCSTRAADIQNDDRSSWCRLQRKLDKQHYGSLFDRMDTCFYVTNSAGLLLSGFLAERSNLRIFLFLGMFAAGCCSIAFGLGYFFNIAPLWYYLVISGLAGLAQATGLPTSLALLGNWFNERSRGLILSLWTSHELTGNVAGDLIVLYVGKSNWLLSFAIPGGILMVVGTVMLLTSVSRPADLSERISRVRRRRQLSSSYVSYNNSSDDDCLLDLYVDLERDRKPVGFGTALLIPGVIEFSLTFFFARLVQCIFFFWLPDYLRETKVFHAAAYHGALTSIIFNSGGVAGSVLAGIVYDTYGMRAVPVALMFSFGSVIISWFQSIASAGGHYWMCGQLFVLGGLIRGPVMMISSVVVTDLATHESLPIDVDAVATVAGIINGAGNMGTVIGPFLVRCLYHGNPWNHTSYIFWTLLVCNAIAVFSLVRIVFQEWRR